MADLTPPGPRWSSSRHGYWLPEGAGWLDELTPPRDASGSPRPSTAVPRPRRRGRRAADDGYEVAYLCLDAEGNGHVTPTGQPVPCQADRRPETESGGRTDEQKAERKEALANNKAWPWWPSRCDGNLS